jgi:MinD-like ATPase involved in chromosome partitioning or flagellar assembly
MKLGLFFPDSALQNLLEKTKGIESVEVFSLNEEAVKGIDVLILSDSLLAVMDLKEWKEKYSKKKIVYMVTNQSQAEPLKKIQLFCNTHGIHMIPPFDSKQQVVDEISRYLFPNSYQLKQGNKVVFMTTHPGAGGTSLALGVADEISNQTRAKVGVIHLNPWNEGTYEAISGKSIEDIYPLVKNNSISYDQLFQSFSKVNNFYVLQGNRDLKKILDYDPSAVKCLIQMTSEIMDVVLLDVGAYLDNPLAVEGVRNGDTHYLITTQEKKGLLSFHKTYAQILERLKLEPQHFYLIVNKFESHHSFTSKLLSQKMNVPLLIETPVVATEYREEIDNQEKLLSQINGANDSMQRLALGLIEQYEFEIKRQKKESNGWNPFRIKSLSNGGVK